MADAYTLSSLPSTARINGLRAEDDENNDDLNVLRKELRRLRRECDKANAYNADLRQQVDLLSKELAKAKANADVQSESIAVQVTPEELEAYVAEGNWLVASQKANVSVADCVRAAAEEVTARIGYVYDEQSGYYYDSTSGYYYNAEQSLYYDAKTGIYFFYNSETKTYDFHSQIDVSQLKQSEKETTREAPKEEEEQLVVEVEDDVLEKKSSSGSSEDKKDAKIKKKKSRKHKLKGKDTKKDGDRRKRKRNKEADSKSHRRTKRLRSKENRKRARDSQNADRTNDSTEASSLEEGECSGSENSSDKIGSEGCSDTVDKTVAEESLCRWPPGIRVIVRDTAISKLAVGTLFIVTCSGAIVGREKSADIQLVDMEVSKSHAEFSYVESDCRYVLKDLGSQNGTFFNGVRLSESKLESESESVSHGDIVQLGSTTLLLHIHNGTDTCDDCEPGQIQASIAAQNPEKKTIVILSKEEKERERKRALKQIKKKFGLEDVPYTEETVGKDGENYTDRANVRRKTKGSDNPYEKTEVASTDRAIPAKNKGFKMLEKMGWSSGQSLGKSQAGIVEPITVEGKMSKVGLGFDGGPMTCLTTAAASAAVSDKKDAVRRDNWSKAQQRYDRLQSAAAVADVQQQQQPLPDQEGQAD